MISISDFYKSIFGCKVYKISIDAGCTCPNRDGTKAFGGCIFCSEKGSGDFVANSKKSIKEQIAEAKLKINSKIMGRSGLRSGKYIAYFQNFTSTYGNPSELEKKYLEAINCDDVVGLAIATRPDCLNEEILEKIVKISESKFVQIELGLQTSNENTGKLINRCYTNDDFYNAVKKIKEKSPKIHIVAHCIFGLPYETEKDMMKTVDFIIENKVDGIKITVLYVLKNTILSKMYENNEFEVLSKEQYLSLIEKAIKKFPIDFVVHRLTGDPPKNILIAPFWTTDKKKTINYIQKILDKNK